MDEPSHHFFSNLVFPILDVVSVGLLLKDGVQGLRELSVREKHVKWPIFDFYFFGRSVELLDCIFRRHHFLAPPFPLINRVFFRDVREIQPLQF